MREFLHQIVVEAGRISLEYRSSLASLSVDRKSARDLVTEADVAVERFLVEQIRQRYPEHGIIGEESGTLAGNEYRWIIDPIDGTTSFVHGQPFYSVSVAVEKNGQLILGAVNAPALGELFEAELGHGATLNGHPIRVSQRSALGDCVLGTGFACMRDNLSSRNLPFLGAVLPRIRDLRRYGSAAIDLGYVACGRLDGFWEMSLAIYDVAAGMLILREAGGTVTDFAGKPDNIPAETLASNGQIHDELIAIMASVSQTPLGTA